jgi:hypothetical protein
VRLSADGERPDPTWQREAGRIEIVLADGRRVAVVGAVDREALAAVLCVLSLDPEALDREGGRSC